MQQLLGTLFRNHRNKPFDAEYYNEVYGCYNSNLQPETHFLETGMAKGFKPRQDFDPLVYALLTPRVQPGAAFVHALMNENRNNYSIHDAISELPKQVMDFASTAIQGPSKQLKMMNAFCDPAPVDPLEMEKAYRTPIDGTCETARFWISAPSSEEFLKRIEQRRSFCYIKLPHGFWDRMVWINKLSDELGKLPNTRFFSETHIQLLATRLLGELQPDFRKQLFLSDAFVQDVLEHLKHVQGREGVFIGMALTGYPTESGIAKDVRSFFRLGDERVHALQTAFPKGYDFWDGTLLKRLAICGALQKLPELIKDRSTLFILSDRFDGIGRDWSLVHSEHLVIPRKNSHTVRHEILREAAMKLKRMCQQDQSPVVMAQAGGALTFWLLANLQERFPKATLIDMGQSIDIWRVNSDVAERPWFRVNANAILENNPEARLANPNLQEN